MLPGTRRVAGLESGDNKRGRSVELAADDNNGPGWRKKSTDGVHGSTKGARLSKMCRGFGRIIWRRAAGRKADILAGFETSRARDHHSAWMMKHRHDRLQHNSENSEPGGPSHCFNVSAPDHEAGDSRTILDCPVSNRHFRPLAPLRSMAGMERKAGLSRCTG